MKIVIFHPVLLPPKDYGGAERVALWLTRGLIERGHNVSVVALRGSQLPKGANLISVEPDQTSPARLRERLPAGVDCVHFFAPPGEDVERSLGVPSLTTVHGNGKPGEEFPLNSVFVSANHAERHRASVFVYNGLDPKEYEFSPNKKGNDYLFLSKTSWRVKNLTGAVQYCSRAGVSLRIAGGSRPWGLRSKLWVKNILGLSSAPTYWEGPVAGLKKAKLLAQARGFVFPVTWPEPFGLVVAESLISGTPVFASPLGSLPELVNPEVGALLKGSQEWVEALRAGTDQFDPERCRRYAYERFHYLGMCAHYEELYRRVASGQTLHLSKPIAGDWKLEA